MSELGEGDSFGPYTVRERLGEGGMGHVFCAAEPGGSEVALKVLRPELSTHEGFRARFEREAKMASKVRHPNIVPVLDRGEIDGSLYLTQAFIGGGSLEERLEREGRLSLEDTVRICDQVAAGLDAMHEAGLVHRDVKPPNIMLDTEGKAFIADLGLAKDREASVILTRLGQAVWAHLRDEPADPCAGRAEIPPDFGAAVNRALAKEPEGRPQSASAYARALRAAAGLAGSEVPS